LKDLPPGPNRYVVDLGCGPGHTTALLREAFPHGFATGIDASNAMIAEARTRVPDAFFFVGDVTEPLALPAHIVFSRLLLGHLPDQAAVLTNWARAVLPGGKLVCEEPVRYRSELDAFSRYEEAVTELVAVHGGTLWASAALDADPSGSERCFDRVIEHRVTEARAAGLFWRNAMTWGGDDDLIAELREIEATAGGTVIWELRQTAWVKR
jgi:SAM-dependent methyltransferase